jgi:hypothetical protein
MGEVKRMALVPLGKIRSSPLGRTGRGRGGAALAAPEGDNALAGKTLQRLRTAPSCRKLRLPLAPS